MAIKGYRDLSSVILPPAQDLAALRKFQLADGTSQEQLFSELVVAASGLAGEFARHPLWRSLVSFQDDPAVNYAAGASSYADAFTEYGRGTPQHAERSGHMLPLRKWDAQLGWTWAKLKEMGLSEGQDDINLAIDRMRNRYRQQAIQRLLQRGDDSGAGKGLGTSGYSPGFATAASVTNVDFTPPAFGGTTFTDTHEHYVAAAGGWTAAIIEDMEAELMEHGHAPTYRLLISGADEGTVTGLTGFVKAAPLAYQLGSGSAVAQPEEEDSADGFRFIGSYQNTRVYVTPGMPQYYGFSYRSYGALSPRNPVRVRVEKGQSAPAFRVLSGGADDEIKSVRDLMLYIELGVGVGDRTNGTTRYVNNATWADGVAL